MAVFKVNLHKPYVSQDSIELASNVLRSGWIGEGPVVKEFEQAITDKFGYRNVLATNSGTSALHLALVLAGVGAGDEVLTSAQTCSATGQAILAAGARPVYADIDYMTGNVNPLDILHRRTERTKAILCIHWGGLPCDMAGMRSAAQALEVPIIQDAAHALGARYGGYPIDHYADYTMISLQAIKIVTTIDGGLLCCKLAAKYEEGKRRRWFGIDRDRRIVCDDNGYWDWNITELGFKYHMNDVCAAVGLGNLTHYDELYAQRKAICSGYRDAFANIDGIQLLALPPEGSVDAHWLFTMHVEERPLFVRAMADRGIETGIVHRRNDVYDLFGGRRDDLPNLDKWEKTAVCLPLHNQLTDEDVAMGIGAVKEGW